MSVRDWGWHARACSRRYLSCEFAQSLGPPHAQTISDAQVAAFCHWWRHEVEPVWGHIPMSAQAFPTHAEAEAWGYTGAVDGKTDCYAYQDPRATDLRARIAARLADGSW